MTSDCTEAAEAVGIMTTNTGDLSIVGVPTHGGEYIKYNVLGSEFEVPKRYTPPVRVIGRGAYGIVW